MTNFDIFWEVWPSKRDKGHARKWWRIHKPDDELVNTIIAAVKIQTDAGMINKGDQYTPLPTTWLNGERWDDEIVVKELTPLQKSNLAHKKLLEEHPEYR